MRVSVVATKHQQLLERPSELHESVSYAQDVWEVAAAVGAAPPAAAAAAAAVEAVWLQQIQQQKGSSNHSPPHVMCVCCGVPSTGMHPDTATQTEQHRHHIHFCCWWC
jgi:hypothetical protein